MSGPLRVALVAGEASGDTLGAGLIQALRRREPNAEFFGVAGPKMRAAGCEVWEPAESLAVMGLYDVLRELPRLWRLISKLRRAFIAARPDIFVGIDAPDTNLRLARRLHRAGIPTVQYVSPQVWAWRQRRVHTIHESVDLVLCLLPFERKFYENQGVAAEFVGHPLADAIPLAVDRAAARERLGLAAVGEVVALLPGSRRGEVTRLAADFAKTALWLAQHRPGIRFVAPMASDMARDIFSRALNRVAPQVEVLFRDGEAQTALIAADVALIASGTATLEAALCKRPMVVVYRTGPVTAFALRRLNLVKSKFFAQPNLLADRRVVGEYFQEQVDPPALGAELSMWLDDAGRRAELEQEFVGLHVDLKRDASERAAQAIIELLQRRKSAGSP
jgi:lipid-A-disaccharide synthase